MMPWKERSYVSPAHNSLSVFTQKTISDGNDILNRLLTQPPGDIRILEILDDLSDLLCRVADPATYIRQVCVPRFDVLACCECAVRVRPVSSGFKPTFARSGMSTVCYKFELSLLSS